jgi:transcriptional regulator GlxA family with amidase domain
MQRLSIATQSMDAAQAAAVSNAVAAIVVRLLDDADRVLDADRHAAKSCIARASALLQAECARTDQADARSGSVSGRSGLAPWQVRKVKAYMDENLHTPIRANTLATITRLSASYFSVAFKRSLGEPVHTYLTRRRVERVQELMLMTEQSLSQIALACGFCDQAHMSRLFRRATGISPNLWRRERLAQPN